MAAETNLKIASAAKRADLAVFLEGVTVSYRSYKERPTSLKESILRFLKSGRVRYFSTFDALKNLNLEIERGKVFGIIGSNGAGKSTLLKVIAGVLPPTSGTVEVNGKIDSLIQLGAGFDSELNAIENIFLNCSLHQKSKKEIEARIPHILEFAELEEFATTPIKYYSSGMFARLGFSVAIDREPDILIVDEVLAVGDERFQKKCKKVFERLLEQKKTVIMVSHSLEQLRDMSDQIAVLSKGRLIYLGEPKKALEIYRDSTYQTAL